jgi:hypothetical protein
VNGSLNSSRYSAEQREISDEPRDPRESEFRTTIRKSPEDKRSDHPSKPNEVLQQSRIQYDLEKKEVPIKAHPVKSLNDSKPRRSRSSSRSRSDSPSSSSSSDESDEDSATEEQKKEKKVEVCF